MGVLAELNPQKLASLKTILAHLNKAKLKNSDNLRKAAVLVPLCEVNGKTSLLFTVRSSDLRNHSGEVRFLKKEDEKKTKKNEKKKQQKQETRNKNKNKTTTTTTNTKKNKNKTKQNKTLII